MTHGKACLTPGCHKQNSALSMDTAESDTAVSMKLPSFLRIQIYPPNRKQTTLSYEINTCIGKNTTKIVKLIKIIWFRKLKNLLPPRFLCIKPKRNVKNILKVWLLQKN